RAVGLLFLSDAATDDHVEIFIDQFLDHFRRTRRVIGRVTVDEQINIRLDVGEHPADDMTFALTRFVSDDSAGLTGDLRRAVLRIIVVDVNDGARQRLLKFLDHFRDRGLFVVAGYKHGDAAAGGRRTASNRIRRWAESPHAWP